MELDSAEARYLPSTWNESAIRRRGALLRTVQIAAALECVLELTTVYVRQREQFGRPIVSFQAVSHPLAVVAAEVAAAVESAAEGAIDLGADDTLAVAAAKVYVSDVAGSVAATAHQSPRGRRHDRRVCPFTFSTRRLWAWRDEYGSEVEWAAVLGQMIVDSESDGAWPRTLDPTRFMTEPRLRPLDEIRVVSDLTTSLAGSVSLLPSFWARWELTSSSSSAWIPVMTLVPGRHRIGTARARCS